MDLLKSFALSLFSVIKIKLYAANFPCANPGGHVCKYALSAGEDDSVRLNPREEATVFLVRKPALNGKDGSVSFEVDAKRDYYLVKDGAKYIVSKFEPTKQFGKLKLFNKGKSYLFHCKIYRDSVCRIIYKVDHRSYDRAKTHMIRQNLFAR